MPWFFKSKAAKKSAALPLIMHLQKMLAYQQLSMEIYNDALLSVSREPNTSSEAWQRPTVELSNPAVVSEYLLPALQRKIEIVQSMEEQHNTAAELAGNFSSPYEDMATGIHLMLQRAQLQFDGFTSWIANPSANIDTMKFDEAESQAMHLALLSLNALVQKVMTTDEWMEVNRHALNDVREMVGLSALSQMEFRDLYSRGVSGENIRMFSINRVVLV